MGKKSPREFRKEGQNGELGNDNNSNTIYKSKSP